jgi:hypothetical protein
VARFAMRTSIDTVRNQAHYTCNPPVTSVMGSVTPITARTVLVARVAWSYGPTTHALAAPKIVPADGHKLLRRL